MICEQGGVEKSLGTLNGGFIIFQIFVIFTKLFYRTTFEQSLGMKLVKFDKGRLDRLTGSAFIMITIIIIIKKVQISPSTSVSLSE